VRRAYHGRRWDPDCSRFCVAIYNPRVRCPACDEAAPERSRFCPFCGRPLVDLEATRLSLVDDGETVASIESFGDARSVSPVRRVAVSQIPSAALTSGVVLADRYRIVRQLGRGGMGVVYHAEDLRLGHPVALKFLSTALAGDARRLVQFHNEVSVARQVSHPNVCRVDDIGDVNGQLFLSMEYVDGVDLAAQLGRRGAFSEEAAVDIIRGICAGLAAVHARGVLHRDLKPANIMMTASGQPKLMDFGIAAVAGEAQGERFSEGTPAYMAPEQIAGAEATTKSDIFALGLVMLEMMTASRAVTAGTLDELTSQQQALSVGSGGAPATREPAAASGNRAVFGARSGRAASVGERSVGVAADGCARCARHPSAFATIRSSASVCMSTSSWSIAAGSAAT
jgi:hypothetical protein